jgi:hypothetical protein
MASGDRSPGADHLPVRQISGQRGARYGEVLAVFADDGRFTAHVYGTQLLNDCPPELWQALDADAIARELGALVVKLNGPRYWMLDGLGAKGQPIEPVLREFNGLMTRRIAVVDLGTDPVQTPYTLRRVDRKAAFFFDEGTEVHELIDHDGAAYVMQSYCVGVDPTMAPDVVRGLGGRLQLPAGWQFRSRTLTEELVVDTSMSLATVVQDELENSYCLVE